MKKKRKAWRQQVGEIIRAYPGFFDYRTLINLDVRDFKFWLRGAGYENALQKREFYNLMRLANTSTYKNTGGKFAIKRFDSMTAFEIRKVEHEEE